MWCLLVSVSVHHIIWRLLRHDKAHMHGLQFGTAAGKGTHFAVARATNPQFHLSTWDLVVVCVRAGTPVNLQVLSVNLGNTFLENTEVSVPEVTDLSCMEADGTTADADVTAVGTALIGPSSIPPKTKLLCVGSFIFSQTELDKNQPSKSFTPAVNTSTSAAAMDNAALGGSYTPALLVSIGAQSSLVIAVNATACSIPSILPSDANSE